MKLKASSKLVRWTYYFNTNHRPPTRTSLCALFWRGFVFMPATVILVLIASTLILHDLWIAFSQHMRITLLLLGTIILGALIIWGCVNGIDTLIKATNRRRYRKLEEMVKKPYVPPQPSVFWEGLKAIKAKVCPIIEIEE